MSFSVDSTVTINTSLLHQLDQTAITALEQTTDQLSEAVNNAQVI